MPERLSILAVFVFLGISFSYGQEICNNGIDDDANGLIDLNDPQCACTGTGITTPASLIPNPSFEDTLCCPIMMSELSCADQWVQASDGTSDYFNSCGGVPTIFLYYGLQPFPDGEGAVGMIVKDNYREYIGTCLSAPLVAGTYYSIQLDVAFFHANPQYAFPCTNTNPVPPINLTIFGAPTCGNIPYPGFGCPPAPFMELGSVAYDPANDWQTVTITFLPTVDIAEIVIGAPCILPVGWPDTTSTGNECIPYLMMDNLLINTSVSLDEFGVGLAGSFCNNTAVLAASPVLTGGTWQWYKNGIAIVGQTNPTLSLSVLGLGGGDYTCTFSRTEGCTSSSIFVPALDVSLNPATICAGDSATLTATGATSCAWSPATGLSATTGTSVMAGPSATTTYTVSGISSGCQQTLTVTVTVEPITSPVISVNPATICTGSAVTLTAAGAYTYTWSPATGLSAVAGSSVTANPVVTTTYTVTGTTPAGCSSGSGTSIVTVNPIPTVNVDPATICAGSSAILTATGANTYVWSPATGLSATTGSSVTSSPSETTTYVIEGTDNGCTGTTAVVVMVNPTATIGVNSGTICSGESVVLNATGGSSYSWSPATGLSSTTGSQVTASPAQTTTYTVTETIPGCPGMAVSTVTVLPGPVITIPDVTTCEDGIVVLTASGADTYAWSPATGLSATTGSAVTASVSVTTVYNVIGTTGNCSGTGSGTVIINNNVPMNILASPNPAPVDDPTVHFIGLPSDQSLMWSFGENQGTATGSETMHTYPNEEGIYEVTLVVHTAAGCIDTARMTVAIDNGLVIYVPNAFTPDGNEHNNTFRPVITSGFDTEHYKLFIYNRWGELIFTTQDISESWDGTFNDLPVTEGVYTWTIRVKSTKDDTYSEFDGDVTVIR